MPIFASQSGRKSVPLLAVKRFGTVAQLDNASGYGPEDWGFESLRYHTFLAISFCWWLFFQLQTPYSGECVALCITRLSSAVHIVFILFDNVTVLMSWLL